MYSNGPVRVSQGSALTVEVSGVSDQRVVRVAIDPDIPGVTLTSQFDILSISEAKRAGEMLIAAAEEAERLRDTAIVNRSEAMAVRRKYGIPAYVPVTGE